MDSSLGAAAGARGGIAGRAARVSARAAFFLLAPLLLAALLASCRSAPAAPQVPAGAATIPLEPGGFAYVLIDVERARPIIGHLEFMGMDASDRQFRQMLDSTRWAIAAVYMPREGEPEGTRIRLAAQGNFPSGRASMGMNFSRHWRGQRSATTGDRFWYSSAALMSMAISSREAHVSTSLRNEPVDPFYVGEGTEIPEGFNEFREGAIISTWLDSPGEFINDRLAEMHIPLEIPAEQLFMSIFQHEPQGGEQMYTAHLTIQMPGEAQAAGFATVLSFARLLFAPPPPAEGGGDMAAALLSILFNNPTTAEGRNLHIRTGAMTAREVSELFGMFIIM